MLLNDGAGGIDHEDGGKSSYTTVSDANGNRADSNRIIDPLGGDKLSHLFFIIFIDCQADHLQAILVAFLQLNQSGNLLTAGAAPGGPEIQQHHFAAIIFQLELFPIEVFCLKGGAGSGSRTKRMRGNFS